MAEDLKKKALEYHSKGKPGKFGVRITKKCDSVEELSLAYTPGVAEPCLEIHKDPSLSYKYTSRGNVVGVISNGTAVLGLGDIGALAGMPVMEGKCVLFKKFAGIDAIPICLGSKDPKELVTIIKSLEPTLGGINLEDIKAPECFYVENELKKIMKIPVFHDDQHGTAIISGAALLNGLEIAGKKVEAAKVVLNGAGAAGLACASFYLSLGVKKENLIVCDTKGVIYKGRKEGMNEHKERFAAETDKRTLKEALRGADLFLGVSAADCLTPEMIKSMNDNPLVFAMANPDPEIKPEIALKARDDIIIATGRSDYPNQINNVLAFPYLFRAALDTRSSTINEEMKKAAAYALANLAKKEVPEYVSAFYNNQKFEFGPSYIIPTPFDKRVLLEVAPAVAKAAMESGVASKKIDLEDYRKKLEKRLRK